MLTHPDAPSPAVSAGPPALPQYRYSVYFETVEADPLLHRPGFQEMVLPGWVSCWDVSRRAECSYPLPIGACWEELGFVRLGGTSGWCDRPSVCVL